MVSFMKQYEDQTYALLRIVSGLHFSGTASRS
jgi:hypothetical protein